jgi:hypothetical protein
MKQCLTLILLLSLAVDVLKMPRGLGIGCGERGSWMAVDVAARPL